MYSYKEWKEGILNKSLVWGIEDRNGYFDKFPVRIERFPSLKRLKESGYIPIDHRKYQGIGEYFNYSLGEFEVSKKDLDQSEIDTKVMAYLLDSRPFPFKFSDTMEMSASELKAVIA